MALREQNNQQMTERDRAFSLSNWKQNIVVVYISFDLM